MMEHEKERIVSEWISVVRRVLSLSLSVLSFFFQDSRWEPVKMEKKNCVSWIWNESRQDVWFDFDQKEKIRERESESGGERLFLLFMQLVFRVSILISQSRMSISFPPLLTSFLFSLSFAYSFNSSREGRRGWILKQKRFPVEVLTPRGERFLKLWLIRTNQTFLTHPAYPFPSSLSHPLSLFLLLWFFLPCITLQEGNGIQVVISWELFDSLSFLHPFTNTVWYILPNSKKRWKETCGKYLFVHLNLIEYSSRGREDKNERIHGFEPR